MARWPTGKPHDPGEPEDFFSKPNAIAEEVFHTAHQYRATWSFNVELRPFGENGRSV